MVESLKKLGDLTRVAANADPDGIVTCEDIIENFLASRQLVFICLTLLPSPKLILVRETLLELDLLSESLDEALASTVIACSDADALAEKLLHHRDERLILGEFEALESLHGGLDAAGQRRRVVRVEVWHALVLKAGLVVGVCLVSLGFTCGCEESILPCSCSVARLKTPVALQLSVRVLRVLTGATYVPGGCTVKGLSGVMPALTMTSHDKNLVACLVAAGIAVQVLDVLLEALPLSLVALSGVLGISGISAVQKTKVPLGLNLSASINPVGRDEVLRSQSQWGS